MALRILGFALWAGAGGVLAYGLLSALDIVGLLVVVGGAAGALAARATNPKARAETLGLVAGPGVLFVILGEAGDAPGLGGIGLLLLAATVTVHLHGRRRDPAGA